MSTTEELSNHAGQTVALRVAHRKRRLREIAQGVGHVTALQLRNHARTEGLEPTIEDCRDVLKELYPEPPKVSRLDDSKVLVVEAVARELPQPFTLAQLVVACHRARPDLFSLDDYPSYPSEHRVRCTLWGQYGLIGQGVLRREGKALRVCEAGGQA